MIRVHNVEFYGRPQTEDEIYVGLWAPKYVLPASPLGNRPGYGKTPKVAVASFREWFQAVIEGRETGVRARKALEEFKRLCALYELHDEIVLLCHCAPEAGLTWENEQICHGQVIAEFIERETRFRTELHG